MTYNTTVLGMANFKLLFALLPALSLKFPLSYYFNAFVITLYLSIFSYGDTEQ